MPDILRQGAMAYGLDYCETHREKGWLTVTVYYRVTGPASRIAAFLVAVQDFANASQP